MKPGTTKILLPAIVFLLVLTIPVQVEAVRKHYFDCIQCHDQNTTLWTMDGQNVCLKCHGDPPTADVSLLDSSTATAASAFTVSDASDAMGNHPSPGTGQFSHNWALNTDTVPSAGASRPLSQSFYSRYQISDGKLTCSRCHNPHGADTSPLLLKIDNSADQYCLDCHRTWDQEPVGNPDATLTHPVGFDYSDYESDTARFKPAVDIPSAAGDVRLVGGKVSCTSCHGMHYTDSNSLTSDGMANYPVISNETNYPDGGDGHLLRSDGVQLSGANQNEKAQLRSNLCQACHTYKLHGAGSNQIGCLDCHGGHSYNKNNPSQPNIFVLNYNSVGQVPVRANGLANGTAVVSFPAYTEPASAGNSRDTWGDESTSSANGYCESCHGDINGLLGGGGPGASEHTPTNENQCVQCHIHDENAMSFGVDGNANICGGCHGFPPYLNLPGDKDDTVTPGTDGGYAYNFEATPPYGYNSVTYYKDETQTGHKAHAGAGLPGDPGTWYAISSGLDNCRVCHGPQAGSSEHKEQPSANYNTFRTVAFDGIAVTGGLTPVYQAGAGDTCDTVYCHSNGGPRTGDGPTRNYNTVTTPSWDGGFGAIMGQTNPKHECEWCHGNTWDTMISGSGRSNSPAHQAHLGQEQTGKSFGCNVCHLKTADNSTTISTTYNATNQELGGTHVNGTADVDFILGGSALYNAVSGGNYDSNAGTCDIYCHNVPTLGVPAGTGDSAVDWDSGDEAPNTLNCDSCHRGLPTDTTPIDTGSHTVHINPAMANISCDECHGAGAMADGSHSGHLDGTVTVTDPTETLTYSQVCNSCHGVEGGDPAPAWGDDTSTDCITCHTGASLTSYTDASSNPVSAPDKTSSLNSGHNYNSATPYPATSNGAANKVCDDCHKGIDYATTGGHVDGVSDDWLQASFACEDCHTAAGSRQGEASVRVKTHDNTDGSYSFKKQPNFTKLCLACHDPHGTSNIAMIYDSQSAQNAEDPDYVGGADYTAVFSGDVVMARFNSVTLGDGFDELDGGGANNVDDICSTCHNTTGHNAVTVTEATKSHKEGQDCTSCHAHNGPVGGFMPEGGDFCDDCHGYPPTIVSEMPDGGNPGAHSLHAKAATNDPASGLHDPSDCVNCHGDNGGLGYDLSPDGTHQNGSLTLASGMSTSTCSAACHKSDGTDGFWTDTNGLDCDACHYSDLSPSSGGNSTSYNSISASHDAHFDAVDQKVCADCHDVSFSPSITSIPGGALGLAHIEGSTAPTEGQQYADRAEALQGEATLDFSGGSTSYTFNDSPETLNTCSSPTNNGLGCHATGTPDWDNPIAPTGCTDCHTDTTSAAVNPTSGLHGNTTAPAVTGNSHDDSFDDGVSPTGGTCDDCHTTAPSTAHANGTLDAYPAVTVAGSVTVYNNSVSPTTCTTACHTAGTNWEYRWTTDVYNALGGADISECNGCHGTYGGSWNTGVIHTENPSRGSGHNTSGSLDYPCADCHAIGASTGVYDWTQPWDTTGTNSSHGDGNLQVNYNSTVFTENAGRAFCNNVSCHGQTDHDFPVSTTFATEVGLTGDTPQISCGGCHGGGLSGDDVNYWPDDNTKNTLGDNTSEDGSGRHQKHMEALADLVYGETASGAVGDDLLRNDTAANPGKTSKDKQLNLCNYCHNYPDGTHGSLTDLPADVPGFKMVNGTEAGVADGGTAATYTAGNATCSNIDCHGEFPTTPGTYGWYDAGTSTCAMCHDANDVKFATNPGGITHTDHTGANTNFGINIGCGSCHDSATDWDLNVKPNDGNHINGTLEVTSGSVTFSYGSGTCGTNDCHNAGNGGGGTQPAQTPYNWGTDYADDCVICHAAVPTVTLAHTPHVGNANYVSGCADCHTAANLGSHIDTNVDFGSKISAPADNTTFDGSCTNDCHLADQAGDWTGGSAVMACTDCHESLTGYVGDGANLHASGLHAMTAAYVTKHDDTLGTGCEQCHTAYGSAPASHVDGTMDPDANNNQGGLQDRFIVLAGYSEQAPNSSTCSGSSVNISSGCHSDDGNWSRLWSTDANTDYVTNPDPGQLVCDVCHGQYQSLNASSQGWRVNTVHYLSGGSADENKGSTHNKLGGAANACEDCHGYDSAIAHENDLINFSGDDGSNSGTADDGIGDAFTVTYNATSPGWHCATCHSSKADESSVDTTTHTFVDSLAFPGAGNIAYVNGATTPEGGCTGCHGNETSGGHWPDGSKGGARVEYNGGNGPADNVGAHVKHVNAIGDRLNGGAAGDQTTDDMNATCDYCHPDPGGGGHNDETAPADMHNGTTTFFKHISGALDDVNGRDGIAATYNATTNTCSNLDCHNSVETPAWYSFDSIPTTAPVTSNVAVTQGVAVVQGTNIDITADIQSIDETPEDVTAAQYQIDALGWLPVDTFTPGTPVSVVASNIATGALSVGDHWIYVRGYDATDGWGEPAAFELEILGQDTVTVTGADIAPAAIEQSKLAAVARLDLDVDAVGDAQASITQITVNRTGTAAAADVAQVLIYDDKGFSTPGIFGSDDAVIGVGTFSGATATIDIADQTVVNGTTSKLYVAYAIADAANTSATVGASVGAGDVTVAFPDTTAGAGASSSNANIDPKPTGGGTTQYFFDVNNGCIFNTTSYATIGLATADNGCGNKNNETSEATLTLGGFDYIATAYKSSGGYAVPTKVTGQASGTNIILTALAAGPTATIELVEAEFGTGNVNQVLDSTTVGPLALGENVVTDLSMLAGTVPVGKSFGIRIGADSGTVGVQWGVAGNASNHSWVTVDESPAASIAPRTYNATVDAGGGPADRVAILQGDPVTLKATMSTLDAEAILAGQYRVNGGSWQNIASPDVGGWDSDLETVTVTNASPDMDTSAWSAGEVRLDVRAQDSDGWGDMASAYVDVSLGSTVYVSYSGGVPPNVRRGDSQKMSSIGLYTSSETTTVTSFTVDLEATEDPADLDMIHIYHDNGDGSYDPATDHIIGSATVSGLSTVVTTAPIIVGLTKEDFYVVYVTNPGATENNSLTARITAIGIDSEDSFLGGTFPLVSNTTTITFGMACGGCHTLPRSSGAHPAHANSDGDFADCQRCHTDNAPYGYTTNPNGTHNNGTPTWDVAIGYSGGLDGTCSNIDCHYSQPSTPNWSTGSTDCTSCHAYPPAGPPSTVDHTNGGTRNMSAFMDGHDDCMACHGRKSATQDGLGAPVANQNYNNGFHADGNILMNGPATVGAGYNSLDNGCDIACHGNTTTYQMNDSTSFGLNYADVGQGCTGCHNTSVQAANVWYGKGHTDSTGYTCKTCHWGHEQGEIIIPNNPAVGIDFGDNGETGISLGSSLVPGFGTATTEAEFCWACHDANGVSEWGDDTDGTANAAEFLPGNGTDYNYGAIYSDAGLSTPTSNWFGGDGTGAYWDSANFAYKTGKIQSTHTGNTVSEPAAAGLDTVAQVRCSYCHDLHDTNTAPGDSSTGRPYLRGTWKRNPYREDGAPQLGQSNWTTNGNFGVVPRGGNQSVELGGYQIDQNNVGATAGYTADNSAGICILCHDNNIDGMNKYGTASNAWVGTNGHSNAVVGGSGSVAVNLFNWQDRHPGATGSHVYTGNGSHGGRPSMGYTNELDGGLYGAGWRGTRSGWPWAIGPSAGSAGHSYTAYNWGATVDHDDTTNTIQTQYHSFSCSKCHNPHASRLPRLMITNCLDTKHNTWDDGHPNLPSGSNPGGSDTAAAYNDGNQFSNASSAQNCHRLADPTGTAGGNGWNLVTPWTDSDGYGTGADPTQDNAGIL